MTKIQDGEPLPFGYQEAVGPAPDFNDTIDSEKSIRVSEPPYVDYMIPRNDGTIGILAQKAGGQFIVGTNAEDPGGGAYGSNQWPDPDRWHPVFEWTDGSPFPFGSDYWGVSHSGWLPGDQLSTLITRIDLASDQEVTVYHWFNDGYKYSSWDFSFQDSHTLMVTHYTADGAIVDDKFMAITSGGAEGFFGDERLFACAQITATATAPGDYLILMNAGGNIGYKGTAVALLPSEETDWYGYPVDVDGWADTTPWLGWVNVTLDPWIWVVSLNSYIYIGNDSGWVFVPAP
ncbi:MAG: hypothetical protein AB3N64_14785 [Puniceicoccaceae bacterium]